MTHIWLPNLTTFSQVIRSALLVECLGLCDDDPSKVAAAFHEASKRGRVALRPEAQTLKALVPRRYEESLFRKQGCRGHQLDRVGRRDPAAGCGS